MYSLLKIALRADIRIRALKVSLAVGSILALINHGNSFFNGELEPLNFFQIVATFLVPYLVSTYSSISAIKYQENPSDNKF